MCEKDAIPPCYWNECGSEITQCVNNQDCKSGLEHVINGCDYDECMEDTFNDQNSEILNNVCNGDTTCSQQLYNLGQCAMSNPQCEQQGDDDQEWQYSYSMISYFLYYYIYRQTK